MWTVHTHNTTKCQRWTLHHHMVWRKGKQVKGDWGRLSLETHLSLSSSHCCFLCFYLSGLVSCDSCRDALRHSEYAAGARWVWPHRLVITVQHQTPNYQLTPEPTPTCLKAQWPTPPSVCSIPHSTNPPTAPQPSSVLSKHAPWDASWHHDIQMLRDIRPHLCVSVRLSDPWTLQKRRKSICLCSFRAERGYNSVSFRG